MRMLTQLLLLLALHPLDALFVTPTMTPSTVVKAQLKALKADDIYIVFKYASPMNKAMTGPWQRFAGMVRTPPYNTLIGPDVRAAILMEVNSNRRNDHRWACRVRVWQSPPALPQDFVWELSVVREEPFEGCWMTDSVIPVS